MKPAQPEKKPDNASRPDVGQSAGTPSSLKAPLAPGGALDTLGRASLMGMHLVSGMLVGALLGYGLDRWLDTFPWCSGIGFLFGIGAGFRNMWIDARYLIRQGENRHPDRRHVDKNPPRR